MTTIVTRSNKGSPLSYTEMDNNFINLNTDKVETSNPQTTGSLQHNGNVNLTGTGARITGDFSNATLSNRVMFQTSTTNGSTTLQAIPNGTGNISQLVAAGGSDTANNSQARLDLRGDVGEVQVVSSKIGTGTYLPMTFYVGGLERMRIDTNGRVGFGVNPINSGVSFHIAGDIGVGNPTRNQVTSAALAMRTSDDPGDNTRAKVVLGTTAGASSSDSYISFHTNQYGISSGERMRIDSSGNVGIGAASSGNKLEVSGSIKSSAWFLGSRGTSGLAALATAANTSSGGVIVVRDDAASFNASGIEFYTGTQERVRIGSAGQLGIGGANYGTAGQVLTSNGPSSAPSWASSGTFKTSASAPHTPAAGETLTRAHGLGFAPTSCQLVFECVVADAGYAVGERTYPIGVWNGTSTFFLGMFSDATNCYVKCSPSVWVFIVHKTTGNAVTPTANAWKYYFVGLQ